MSLPLTTGFLQWNTLLSWTSDPNFIFLTPLGASTFVPVRTSTLSSPASSGTNIVTVADTAPYPVPLLTSIYQVVINSGQPNEETMSVAAIDDFGKTLSFTAPLTQSHIAGEPVTVVQRILKAQNIVSGFSKAYYDSQQSIADGGIQIDANAPTVTGGVNLMIRIFEDGSGFDCYYCAIRKDVSSFRSQIFRYVDSAFTQLSDTTNGAYPSGWYQLRFYATGYNPTTIKIEASIDGFVTILHSNTVNDTSTGVPNSGYVGLPVQAFLGLTELDEIKEFTIP